MNNSNQNNSIPIVLEYENIDLPPAYVDNAQGIIKTKGIFHLMFYSE